MTTLKNTTKKGQQLISEYKYIMYNYPQRSIHDVYNNPSPTKVQTFNDIYERACNTDGYDHNLTVSGYNCNMYSTIYSYTINGVKTIVKDTKNNTFCVSVLTLD